MEITINGRPVTGVDIALGEEGLTMSFGLGLGLGLGEVGGGGGGGSSALTVPDYTGQTAIPAAVLLNQKAVWLSDSRGTFALARQSLLGADATYATSNVHYGQGGATIEQVNGINNPVELDPSGAPGVFTNVDLALNALNSDTGIIALIAGTNGSRSGATGYAPLVEEMTKLLKRLNCVPVSTSSQSGTWVRDTSGSLSGVGVQASNGSGGTCTVTGTDTGRVWIRDISGVSNGDTITAGGWSATLNGAIPTHSGRAVLLVTETPRDSQGTDFLAYCEWMDTLHDTTTRDATIGPELTSVRVIDVRSSMWKESADPDHPMPFADGYTDDFIHPNNLGFAAFQEAFIDQANVLLANYGNQRPGADFTPASGWARFMADIPVTGGSGTTVEPTGWNIQDDAARGQSFEIGGTAGNQSIALICVESGAPGWKSDDAYNALAQESSITIDGVKAYRLGGKVKITNSAGTGPAVGIKTARLQWSRSSTLYEDTFDLAYDGWQTLQSVDTVLPSAASGTALLSLLTTSETEDGEVDYRVEFAEFDIWRTA